MESAVLLKCKACGASLDADGVDFRRGIAKCAFCKAVTKLDDPRGEDGGRSERRPVERPKVPLPRRFALQEEPSRIEISWRWFTPATLFLTFFCLFWDGFLVVWYFMAFSTDAPIVMVLFPLIHVAVGVGLTYFVIASYVNETKLTSEAGLLTVRHGPLPWPGNLDLDAASVGQFYTAEKVHRGKNGVSHTYDVFAVSTDGEKRNVLSGLTDADHALFIEQRLEDHLRLVDRPVGGELPR